MTDVTTRPAGPDSPTALPPTPVNGAAVGDLRATRHIVRAEQARISADAEVERRARAARLDLELRESRRVAARRDRQAAAQDKQDRAQQRRTRRTARQAALHLAFGRLADRAVFILPILFPMAVAWVGQIRFAMGVMHWPLAAAVVFAAGFELSTAYVARLDWLSRAKGDTALLFRAATWGFAAGAAMMNYWHAAGPGFAPTGEAVSYGLMSVTGVVLWELLSTYRHRTSLRAQGKLPAARPRYGLARWIWFRSLTRLAWLLALRDSYPTTELAWRAAIAAVEVYGSPRAARKAVRAGRPVPRLELHDRDDHGERDTSRPEERDDQPGRVDRDSTQRDTDRDDAAWTGRRDTESECPQRIHESQPGHRDARSIMDETVAPPPCGDVPERSGAREVDASGVGELPPEAARHEVGVDRGAAYDVDDNAASADGDVTGYDGTVLQGKPGEGRQVTRRGIHKDAVIARMKTYARERVAADVPVTGAELDREFGTCDYGRKVLRQLAAELHDGGTRHR